MAAANYVPYSTVCLYFVTVHNWKEAWSWWCVAQQKIEVAYYVYPSPLNVWLVFTVDKKN